MELQKASKHIRTDDLVFLGLQDGVPIFSAACEESVTELVHASDTEVCPDDCHVNMTLRMSPPRQHLFLRPL